MKAGEVAVPAAGLLTANASGPSAFGGASGRRRWWLAAAFLAPV